jgi:hypothetical protein
LPLSSETQQLAQPLRPTHPSSVEQSVTSAASDHLHQSTLVGSNSLYSPPRPPRPSLRWTIPSSLEPSPPTPLSNLSTSTRSTEQSPATSPPTSNHHRSQPPPFPTHNAHEAIPKTPRRAQSPTSPTAQSDTSHRVRAATIRTKRASRVSESCASTKPSATTLSASRQPLL